MDSELTIFWEENNVGGSKTGKERNNQAGKERMNQAGKEGMDQLFLSMDNFLLNTHLQYPEAKSSGENCFHPK